MPRKDQKKNVKKKFLKIVLVGRLPSRTKKCRQKPFIKPDMKFIKHSEYHPIENYVIVSGTQIIKIALNPLEINSCVYLCMYDCFWSPFSKISFAHA